MASCATASGDTFDENGCKLYPEGSYFVVPGNVPHYGFGKTGDAVYQESGRRPVSCSCLWRAQRSNRSTHATTASSLAAASWCEPAAPRGPA